MKRTYSTKIALVKNRRGVYCLDPIMGCPSGMANKVGGCYGDCYAAKAAKLYGYDFSKMVLRNFENPWDAEIMIRRINRIDSSFVRMGCSGDPSENWEHTIKILSAIEWCNKEIVIITRHWQTLTDCELEFLSRMNICFNTSVSALDKDEVREHCVRQYKRIETYCKSVLRIVSCSFNLESERGRELNQIQENLFANDDVLDTVFRTTKRHPLVKSGVILVQEAKFLGTRQMASKHNSNTYMGHCKGCNQDCGVKVGLPHKNRRGIWFQATLALGSITSKRK